MKNKLMIIGALIAGSLLIGINYKNIKKLFEKKKSQPKEGGVSR